MTLLQSLMLRLGHQTRLRLGQSLFSKERKDQATSFRAPEHISNVINKLQAK